MEDKIIVLRSFDYAVEANLAKTKLDAYGVPCYLTGEYFNGLYPLRNALFTGVRLHVFENDRARALEILDTEGEHLDTGS